MKNFVRKILLLVTIGATIFVFTIPFHPKPAAEVAPKELPMDHRMEEILRTNPKAEAEDVYPTILEWIHLK